MPQRRHYWEEPGPYPHPPHPAPPHTPGAGEREEVRSFRPEARAEEEGEAKIWSQLSRERQRNRDKWRGSMGDGGIDRQRSSAR